MSFFCIHCRSEIDPKYKACPFCGEAITDFLRRYLETPIDGKYQILSRLGVGGMGEVYKVLHIHLNAIRVIKLMRPNIAADAGAGERFLREARLATKIHHPNVAALFDFSDLGDGAWYMVWEYIEGINLHELIGERGPLSPRHAARIAVEALRGLEAIHRAGIVHRDISPENLMIARAEGGEELVKIIDLGIAKQWGEESDNNTKTGMFVGKWKYCSPEHLGMLPDGERIDGRADLYSFGIVLYEMLTGVPPFQADTPHRYLMLHASERPKALRAVNPTSTATPDLESVLFRALEKDRNKRFATARDFANALERLIPSLPDEPGSPGELPLDSEVTEEPTLAVRRNQQNVQTVASISSDDVTVLTKPKAPATAAATVAATKVRSTPAPAKKKSSPLGWIVAIVILVALAAGGYFVMQQRKTVTTPTVARQTTTHAPIEKPPSTAPSSTSATVVMPAAAKGRIAINAFPWANVLSIRNLATGETVPLADPTVTPTSIDVAPGRYEVQLANPDYPAPRDSTVEVQAGGDAAVNITFADPNRATLPDLGGSAR